MPSPDNTSIAPAFAVENPAGVISQSFTFGTPPSVEYGNVGIPTVGAIAVTLAVGDELVVYNGGAGYTEANKSGEGTTAVAALDNSYVNTGADPTGDITIDYEQVGESIVKATVAAISTNSFNAGDQITVDGNGASDEDAVLMIPSNFD